MHIDSVGKRRLRRTCGASCLLLGASIAAAQTTTRESVDANGFQIVHGGAVPAISADGRRVAFLSTDLDLVPGFGDATRQLFVRDRQTGTVQAVSIGLLGEAATGTVEQLPFSMSADGSLIAFSSPAGNLVAGDTNSTYDIFVRDVAAGVTTRASVAPNGGQSNQLSTFASISADGRFVCFVSHASNLVASDTNGQVEDVFVHDRVTGANEIASLTANGAQASGLFPPPSISADGRFVMFASNAVDVVGGDTNGFCDVFVRDRTLGLTERVSLDSAGGQGNGNSFTSAISGDGRFVVFTSFADNLVAGDLNFQPDTFVRDRTSASTTRISVDLSGAELVNGTPFAPATISADGRYVAFVSFDPITPGDTLPFNDVFVRDLLLSQTSCVSCRFNGQVGNRPSKSPALSADGRFIVFESEAKNLVIGDSNGVADVLVRDILNSVGPPIVDYNGPAKITSAGCEPEISATGAASVAGPMSLFVTGAKFIDSTPGVLFWGHAPASIPFHGGNLSVAAPRVRFVATGSLAPAGTPSCLGRFSVHFDANYLAAHLLQAGDDVYAQFIARDPGYFVPDNFALSNGLHFVIQP